MPPKRQSPGKVKAFGANVRRERTAVGMTQVKLAEKSSLDLRTVQKVEAGDIIILITTAMRIRRAIGCDWNRLMPE